MLVLVNSVSPSVLTRTSEKTLIDDSPKIYKKLLAAMICVMSPYSVASTNVMLPAEMLVKSL